MSKTRVEIWMGGLEMPAYVINDPKRVEARVDCNTVRIEDRKGYVFETSPHNMVMIIEPEEKK